MMVPTRGVDKNDRSYIGSNGESTETTHIWTARGPQRHLLASQFYVHRRRAGEQPVVKSRIKKGRCNATSFLIIPATRRHDSTTPSKPAGGCFQLLVLPAFSLSLLGCGISLRFW